MGKQFFRKLINLCVSVSIAFGCLAHAASPSVQEDLDDFDEIAAVHQGAVKSPISLNPILWENEELTFAITSSGLLDDDLGLIGLNQINPHFVSLYSIPIATPFLAVVQSKQYPSYFPQAPPYTS